MVQTQWRTVRMALKKLKLVLWYDQQSHAWAYIWRKPYFKDTYTPMFIAALFTTVKTWERSKCPSIEEFKKNMWYTHTMKYYWAIARWLSGKEQAWQCRRQKRHKWYQRDGFNSWVRKIPWRRKWRPTPVFLLGKSHGQKSLMGYSPRGHKRVGHDLTTKHKNKYSICSNMNGPTD